MNREERKRIYTQLCTEGRITSLMMQPWWLEAAGDWDVALALRNDRVVGAMPYSPGKRFGLAVIGQSVLTHHAGIWMDKPADVSAHKWLTREKQIIWMLLDTLPPHAFISMVFAENSFDNWLPFYWRGFRQEMRYTFVIDRKNSEEIDDDINSSFKKKLRKATESLVVRHDPDEKDFFDVCMRTFSRQKKKPLYSYATYQKLKHAIEEYQAGTFLGAYTPEGELVSVASVVWDNERAYYFLSGDTEKGRDLNGSLYLCREAIRISFEEKGVETFDFCGSMLEPVTEVRRQFGARAVPLMKVFKAGYKWLDILYSLTR